MPDILEEKDWGILLKRIKEGNCTPFLGTGACCQIIPFGSQIANEWAKKYDYPMGDSDNLSWVAKFVAVTEEDDMFPREEICTKIKELIEEVTPKYFKTCGELHGVLADLPLPVYITTNYDDLMVRALKSRGKTPVKEICRWNKRLKQRKPALLDFVPTPERPLVYHLHGCYEVPDSLVLTEDDYLEFLVTISVEEDRLPPRIEEAFTGTSLLLLGYRITDWDFRVLFRLLYRYLEGSFSRKHISVQLVPGNVSETQKREFQKYLDRYFADLHIQVYWHDCHNFAAELKNRWEAFNRGT
ncbi:SIR2 family protein [Methanosarcina hadiensis]|uniref:SIR2 family NAD-dependent protein deacylase n=1 Tax=Methanosarcina hadiensis TaxID=3078083 RepID=UPI0039778CB5